MSSTPRTEAMAAADCRGNYLSNIKINIAFRRYERAKSAMETAKDLTKKKDQLMSQVAQAVYTEFPDTTQTKGPNHASDERGKEKCSRDISSYLRIITDALVAVGTGPFDEDLINSLDEINRWWELSPSWYIEVLNPSKPIMAPLEIPQSSPITTLTT